MERGHLGPSECPAQPCPGSSPPVLSPASPGQVLTCISQAVELPEGLSGDCYLVPEPPVVSPGARLCPRVVGGSPQP